MVQTYEHVVLPSVSPAVTLLLVALSLACLALVRGKARLERFVLLLVLSAFSFFLFSWHVHEKAALLVQVPLLLLAFIVSGPGSGVSSRIRSSPPRRCCSRRRRWSASSRSSSPAPWRT